MLDAHEDRQDEGPEGDNDDDHDGEHEDDHGEMDTLANSDVSTTSHR